MISKCFVSECANKPYGKCDCEEKVTIFCQLHAIQHFEIQNETKRHRCLRLHYTPLQETKILLKSKIIELRHGLKEYRKKIILDAKDIISVVMNNAERILKDLKEIEKKLSKLNLMSELNEILDLSSEKDPENVLKMKASDAEFEMREWRFPDFTSKSDLIISSIKTYFDVNPNPFQPLSDESNTMQDYEYIFFKGNGKELSQINLQTFQETKFTLNLAENIFYQVSSCILPDKSVFYYANPNTTSGYTFIIDKNKNIKQLANSKPSLYLYPIYFDGFIYALGGSNNLAEKYCLKTNTWQSCAPLPAGLNFTQTAAVLFKNDILLTGNNLTKLIKYSPKNNIYGDIDGLTLIQNLRKTLFKGNQKVYVIQTSGNIFESGKNNLSIWNSIGSNNITSGAYSSTYVIEHNGCIYMILLQSQLWEFNLSSKQLRMVRTYN